MQGLNSMNDMLKKNGDEFIKELLNKFVVINEKLNGSFFAVRLNSDNSYDFFKKNGLITHADRVLNKFYNKAIRHFEELPEEVKLNIPEFYVYCFEYFPSKSRLVLSHIHEVNEATTIIKTLNTKKLLEAWARTLLVENPPIFFEGRLSEEQKSKIFEFVYTQDQETSDSIHTMPFNEFLAQTLDLHSTNVDGLVFRFYDDESRNEDTVNVLRLSNPEIEEIIKNQDKTAPKQKADDFIWLILMDLMNFIESLSKGDILSIKIDETSPQKKYVELINNLYINYMEEYGSKWDGLDIRIPDYLKTDEFDLNTELINNDKVKELINKESVHREIYRILLNSFRNPNIKVNSNLFSDTMKQNLRSQIERLSNLILRESTNESYFSSFYEFVGK